MEFSPWLRGQMEKNNWTQEGLGKQVGVAQVTVGKWLKGENLPDPKSLRKLAEITNYGDCPDGH
jgi:transcriptional regulator with XRE-family HTH domain